VQVWQLIPFWMTNPGSPADPVPCHNCTSPAKFEQPPKSPQIIITAAGKKYSELHCVVSYLQAK